MAAGIAPLPAAAPSAGPNPQLLPTIHVPRDIRLLPQRLPKPQYDAERLAVVQGLGSTKGVVQGRGSAFLPPTQQLTEQQLHCWQQIIPHKALLPVLLASSLPGCPVQGPKQPRQQCWGGGNIAAVMAGPPAPGAGYGGNRFAAGSPAAAHIRPAGQPRRGFY
eukprot:gene14592-14723_t